MPSRAATKGPVANSGGSGTKRGRISSGAPFYNGRHVTPRGCCCSVKQDHQFLNKISTVISNKLLNVFALELIFVCIQNTLMILALGFLIAYLWVSPEFF